MEIGETLLVRSADEWRAWLDAHADDARDIWLINYKKGSSEQALDYETALDEATCYGWVDTMIKGMDAQRYATRYMPRRANGNWTPGNIERARRLIREGRMKPQGLAILPPEVARPGT